MNTHDYEYVEYLEKQVRDLTIERDNYKRALMFAESEIKELRAEREESK
jgi:hypothetical protein